KVEQLFQQFKSTGEDNDKKSDLAEQVCKELIVHSQLEEELFYPACREKDVEDDTLDEAQVEHDGAKIMIAELMMGIAGRRLLRREAERAIRVHQASCGRRGKTGRRDLR